MARTPTTIILDIETGPLPVSRREFLRPSPDNIKTGNLKDPAKIAAKLAEAQAEFYEKQEKEKADFESGDGAALNAMSGRPLLAGMLIRGEVVQIYDDDESRLLRRTWDMLQSNAVDRIVGHNVIGFDARFLVRRSFVLGVGVPGNMLDDLHRYQPDIWTDTMHIWGAGDRKAMISLSNLCGAMGIPSPKGGTITGATFAANWDAGNRDACLDYNRADLESVSAIYDRWTRWTCGGAA